MAGYSLKSQQRDTMNDTSPSTDTIMAEISQFRQQQQSLILASSKDGKVLCSYAPFVVDDQGRFFLLLSGLAEHSANLYEHQSQQRNLSVLLIEDEQQARNIFARKRLSYQCKVVIWSREHPHWSSTIELLQEKFGSTVDVLAGLGDFKLYQLTPEQGNYVRGFGQAYELLDGTVPMLKTKSD